MMLKSKRLILPALLSAVLASLPVAALAESAAAPSGTGQTDANAEKTLPGGPRPYNMDLGKEGPADAPRITNNANPGLTPLQEKGGTGGTGESAVSRGNSGSATAPGGEAGASVTGSAGATSGAGGAGGGKAANINKENDDKAIQNLLAAAQRVREATQAMAQAPAGEKRTQAIRQANDALLEIQRAMVTLPPDLLLANVDEGQYQKAAEKLTQATTRLHGAVQALAKEPPGERRSAAIKQVNDALMETNQVMINARAYTK